MPRFAANLTMMFTEHPFPQRFGAAARAGFEAVEFLFPYAWPAGDIAAWLAESQLRNVLFNLSPGDWEAGERGIASLPGREAEFASSVEQALDYARVLGTPRLHVMAGLLPEGADRAAHRALYVANLRHAARRAAAQGIGLLIEPINGRDMPGYLLQTQADAHAVCDAVGAPNLQVQMDLYHAQIMEGDLTTKLRRHIGRIGHIQIASVPDRQEPAGGELNVAHLFAELDALGYTGWVGCGYRPRGRTEDGLDWLRPYRTAPAD